MTAKPSGPSSPRPVVLVVDDEPLVRMLAHETLSTGGFDVVEAVDADEALVLLDARPDTCLLFTDVNMPGSINGYGLAQLAVKRRPDLAILITSGGPDTPGDGDLPQGARFMDKPYSPSTLLATVQTLTAKRPLPPKAK
jgi:CheY-like chemotaxis protein